MYVSFSKLTRYICNSARDVGDRSLIQRAASLIFLPLFNSRWTIHNHLLKEISFLEYFWSSYMNINKPPELSLHSLYDISDIYVVEVTEHCTTGSLDIVTVSEDEYHPFFPSSPHMERRIFFTSHPAWSQWLADQKRTLETTLTASTYIYWNAWFGDTLSEHRCHAMRSTTHPDRSYLAKWLPPPPVHSQYQLTDTQVTHPTHWQRLSLTNFG